MLKEKQAGHKIAVSEGPKPRNVINLMDALKRSIEEEAKKGNPVQKQARLPRAASKERKAAPKKSALRRAKG
jgi:non-homologous end joining protein Ku